MLVEKVQEIVLFKQSKWLENYITFSTQKRNIAKKDFKKDCFKLLNNAFYGKTMETIRNRLRLYSFEKVDFKNIIKQQSELTFNVIQKSFGSCDSYTFKQNEVLMNEPIYLGFAVLEVN